MAPPWAAVIVLEGDVGDPREVNQNLLNCKLILIL